MTDASQFIADAFLVVLGRDVSAVELRDTLRGFTPGLSSGLSSGQFEDRGRALVVRLLSSPEFRLLHDALIAGRDTGRDADVQERALARLGDENTFVSIAYEHLLGRPPDEAGRGHYVDAIRHGDSRSSVWRSLLLSREFADRFRRVAPQGGVVPRDKQLCELANPAKWDNPEWVALLRSLGIPDDKMSMHRKGYEFAQLAYGLSALGLLRDDVRVLSVGAGHEAVLYWLANHVGRVIATDRYEGVWQNVQSREGDAGVLHTPRDYAPFPYREDRLVFLQMDGLSLGVRSGVMDVAYSLSSIEHFGGLEGATRAIDEMARVIKPGGILALATEYVISGPPHDETFSPDQFDALIARPGLSLVGGAFDRSVYARYEYAAVDLYANPHQTPHMVVRFNDTVFTTAFVFMRKS